MEFEVKLLVWAKAVTHYSALFVLSVVAFNMLRLTVLPLPASLPFTDKRVSGGVLPLKISQLH